MSTIGLRLKFVPTELVSGAKKAKTAIKGVGTEARKSESAVERLAKNGGKALGFFSSKLKSVRNIALAVGAALSAAAASAVRSALSLDAALGEASTLIEGTTEEMSLMREEARRMVLTFGGTAANQVKGFYQAISAGADGVAGAAVLMTAANKLAIGGVTDVTTAVDILTTATNAYGLENLSLQEASDALFVAMKAGKTTITELASTLGRAIPFAQSLGISFDEVVASVSTLTTRGISTAEAVTGLRGVFSAIVKPTEQAGIAAELLGIKFNKAGIEAAGGFPEFLNLIIEKTGGSSAELAKLFTGVEGLLPVLSLASGGSKKLAEVMLQLENKTGATTTAYEKMAAILSKRFHDQLAKTALVFQELGTILLLMLVPAMENFTKVVEFAAIGVGFLAFTQIPALITKMVIASTGFSLLAFATGVFTTAVNVAKLALIALGGPLGIVWGLIGAAAVAWLVYRDNTKTAILSIDIAESSTRALNKALGLFYSTHTPLAAKSAIDLALENRRLAQSALAAAKAQLALFSATEANWASLSMKSDMEANRFEKMISRISSIFLGTGKTMDLRIFWSKDAAASARATRKLLFERTLLTAQQNIAYADVRIAEAALKEAVTAVTGNMDWITPDIVKKTVELKVKITGLGKAMSDVSEEAKRLAEAAAAAAEAARISESIGQSIGDGFMAMVEGTKTVTEAFRSMARDIIRELYDVIVVQQIVANFMGIDVVKTFIKAIGGRGNISSSAKGNISSSAKGNIFDQGNVIPFVRGGIVNTPTLFPMTGGQTGLIGEGGPEAVMPLSRGKDGKLGVNVSGSTGNITVINHLNISTGVQQTVRAEIIQLLPKITEASKMAVRDSMRRRIGGF